MRKGVLIAIVVILAIFITGICLAFSTTSKFIRDEEKRNAEWEIKKKELIKKSAELDNPTSRVSPPIETIEKMTKEEKVENIRTCLFIIMENIARSVFKELGIIPAFENLLDDKNLSERAKLNLYKEFYEKFKSLIPPATYRIANRYENYNGERMDTYDEKIINASRLIIRNRGNKLIEFHATLVKIISSTDNLIAATEYEKLFKLYKEDIYDYWTKKKRPVDDIIIEPLFFPESPLISEKWIRYFVFDEKLVLD